MNISSPWDIIIYQAANGAIELKGDGDKQTIWANRMQMAQIFGVNTQAISKHIQNIYQEGELTKEPTSSKMELVQNEAGRTVTRKVDYYNLDILIAVGYRINSVTGTKFRQRATQTLRQHITEWFTINPTRIQQNYQLFLQAVQDVKTLAHNAPVSPDDILELIKVFGQTWFSLDAFDTNQFQEIEHSAQTITIHAQDLYQGILILKQELISKGEASDLFAQEKRTGNLEGIVWNIFQSAFGADSYPTIQSKSAHLLYFIVKNHPFTDGNKRSGAFSFVWLLQKSGIDFRHAITPQALTAMTLLIATSDPKDKQRIIDLVVLLLSGSA